MRSPKLSEITELVAAARETLAKGFFTGWSPVAELIPLQPDSASAAIRRGAAPQLNLFLVLSR